MPRMSGASYIHLPETLARSLLRANECWWAESTVRSAWSLIYALTAYQSGLKLHSIEKVTLGVCLFVRVFVTNQPISQPSNVTTYTLLSEIRGSKIRIIRKVTGHKLESLQPPSILTTQEYYLSVFRCVRRLAKSA